MATGTEIPPSEERAPVRIRAWPTIAEAVRALARPPFLTLLMLSTLIWLVQGTLSDATDTAAAVADLVLVVISLYVQIALILAAGARDPGRSTDPWIKEAFRRRVFLRFILTAILAFGAVAIGAVAFVIGAALMGGIVGLAEQAAVIEKRPPLTALGRSAALTAPSRGAVATIFTVTVILPTVGGILAGYVYEIEPTSPAGIGLVVAVALLGAAGSIALTRAFVALGGSPTEVAPRPTTR